MTNAIYWWTGAVVIFSGWLAALLLTVALILDFAADQICKKHLKHKGMRYIRQAIKEKKAREHEEQA